MANNLSYEDLEDRVRQLELEAEEYRRTQDVLQESEERYRSLVENLNDIIYCTDENAKVTYVSPRIESLSGYRPSEVVGRAFTDFVLPDDLPDRMRNFHKVVSGKGHGSEYRVLTKSNEIKWIATKASPLISKGRVSGVQGVLVDITERKLAEVELEKTVSLLRATLDATADGILVVNRQGGIESFNKMFSDMWQIPESISEIRNDNMALEFVLNQVLHPEAFLKKVLELYEQETAVSFDILEFKDGRIFERHSKPQWMGERVVGRVWSFRDVTERKRAEREREKLIEDLREALVQVKTLSGLLPICSSCKKVRDDQGYWKQIEAYIRDHSSARVSHGICPECAKQLYPDYAELMYPNFQGKVE